MNNTSPSREGPDLSAAIVIWVVLAKSECRIRLLSSLMKLGVGFKDVEDFNLSLNLKLRSEKMRNTSGDTESELVKVAMEYKYRDEVMFNQEVKHEQNQMRKMLGNHYGRNTKVTRGIIKN